MGEDFIDTYQAAEELGMSRATLWRLLKERGITRYRVPGSRRALVRRHDLDTLRHPIPMGKRQASETPGGGATTPVSSKEARPGRPGDHAARHPPG